MSNSRKFACAVAAGLVLSSCGPGTESSQGGESRNAVITPEWKFPLGADVIGTNKSFRRVAVASDGTVYAALDTSTGYEGPGAGGVDVVVTQFSAGGRPQWSRRIGSASDETVDGLTVDDDGNVWVAGTTTGSLAAAPQGRDVWVRSFTPAGTAGVSTQLVMKGDQQVAGFDFDSATGTALVGVNSGDLGQAVRSVSPKGEWGQIAQVEGQQIVAVESDDAGSILVGSLELETSDAVTGPVTHKTSYISRYSPTGRLNWKTKLGIPTPSTEGTTLGGLGDDVLRDMSVAPDGSVYAVGNLAPPVSTAFEAGFLVRLGLSDGSFVWQRKLSALDSLTGAPKGTFVRTVDATDVGDVWVTGESKQGFDADYSGTVTSAFAMKFNSGGGQTALRQELSPINNMSVQGAAITPEDKLVYALFTGPGGTALHTLVDLPAEPIVDGADSAEQFGSFGPDSAIDIAARADGGYYAAVRVSTGGGARAGFAPEDLVIARGPGAQWDTPVGVGFATGRISAVDTAPDGSVVAVGTYRVTPASTGVQEDNIWVTKINREGQRVWYRALNWLGDQRISGVSVDAAGNVLVSGSSPTLFENGSATKSNSFVAILHPDGSVWNVVQWGGLLADETSRAVPVTELEFVVASIEESGDVAGRGLVNIKRYSYDGVIIGEDHPDNVPVYLQAPRVTQLTNGAFVVMTTTPVVVGAATTAQIRWHRWSPDFSVRMSQTLPKFARIHQDCITDLEALPNGEMLMSGVSPCTASVAQITRNSGILVRMDDQGSVINTRRTEKALYDTYSAIDALPNGKYFVAGTMNTLLLDNAPGSGDVIVRSYPGTTGTGSGSETTVAPVTTVAGGGSEMTVAPVTTVAGGGSDTTVAPVTTVAPATTVSPQNPGGSGSSATTVAVSPGPTTVLTVPVALDETASDLSDSPGAFSGDVGGTPVTATVLESGQVNINRPSSVPTAKPFVTSLLPGNRSVGVTWDAVAGATSYTVTASGGRMQSCMTSSTTCTVMGLVPGYPYQFIVTALAGQITASDPSLPVKPVLFLKKSSSLMVRKVIPAPTDRKTKVKWKARGVCKVSTAGRITTSKKAGKCTVTRTTTRTKASPATKLVFTVIVR